MQLVLALSCACREEQFSKSNVDHLHDCDTHQIVLLSWGILHRLLQAQPSSYDSNFVVQ